MLEYEERLELITALSDLAEVYFNEPYRINIGAGICYSLMEVCKVNAAYGKMNSLMREIGYTDECDYFEGPEPSSFMKIEDWEPRAYMCLFLSEYLWNNLDESEEEPEPEAEPSIWEKIKSFFKHREYLLEYTKEKGLVTKSN